MWLSSRKYPTMILQPFLVPLLSPFCKGKCYANPAGVGERAWIGGGSGAVRVLHVRHMPHFERKVSHYVRKRAQAWLTISPPVCIYL